MDPSNTNNILKYIIRNTPYGHLKETIENLKSLVGSSAIEEQEIQDEIRLYEEEHLKHVHLNDDRILISKLNKDEENFYFDQSKKLKILVSPLSENIDKISEAEVAQGPVEDFRSSLDKALNEYKNRSFKSGISACNSKKKFV